MARQPEPEPAATLLDREALRRRALAQARQRGQRVARRRIAWRWLVWGTGKALLWATPIAGTAAAAWWLWTQPWHR